MKKIIKIIKKNWFGLVLCVLIAVVAKILSRFIPYDLISPSVFALLIGTIIHPFIKKKIAPLAKEGINFSAKKLLKLSIILMGFSLSFSQILYVGGFSIIVMSFTLLSAFGFGYLFGKIFKMNWKLSGLISAGTGICGGSAIASISPVIKAKNSDIAYAIASTFIFDIIMVIVFPILGRAFNMTDLGYGLWAGTAVNDTSSVVAAGFAFSDIAGNYSIIVKLTRTLSIIPVVLIFSFINLREEKKLASASTANNSSVERIKPNYLKIFPWFILLFLAMVGIKSTGYISDSFSNEITAISKFLMVMALGAIGLNTDFKEMKTNGLKPLLHGFIISLIVVIVSFLVQWMCGQL